MAFSFTEPIEPNHSLRVKYFLSNAPKHQVRTRTGPHCCNAGCGRLNKKGQSFARKVEKAKPLAPKPIRYRFVGLRMMRES